jgi:hypothetical protein
MIHLNGIIQRQLILAAFFHDVVTCGSITSRLVRSYKVAVTVNAHGDGLNTILHNA